MNYRVTAQAILIIRQNDPLSAASISALLLVQSPIHKSHDLRPRTRAVRTEGRRCDARSDALVNSPENSVIIVRSANHIRKRIVGAARRRSGIAMQEGHDLRTADNHIRAECGRCSAHCNTLVNSPENSVIVIRIAGYIRERIQCSAACTRGSGQHANRKVTTCTRVHPFRAKGRAAHTGGDTVCHAQATAS